MTAPCFLIPDLRSRAPRKKRPVAEIAADLLAQYKRARLVGLLYRPAYPLDDEPYTDPNDEHRLTAHDLGVGKERV